MTSTLPDPNNIGTLLSEAQTALQHADYPRALDLAGKILDIDSNHKEALRIRDEANLQRAKQLAPEDLRLAERALLVGDFEKASELVAGYQDSLVVDFRKKVKRHEATALAISNNNLVAALPLLEQIHKEDPDASIVLENLPRARYHNAFEAGNDALNTEEYRVAETKFREALKYLPGDSKARQLLEQAREKQRKSEQVANLLTRAQVALMQQKYQQAIDLLEEASGLDSSEEIARKLTEARDLFNEARRKTALQLTQDGDKFAGVGELEHAQEKYTSALQLVPTFKEASKGQEEVQRLLKEREKGDSAYRTALSYLEAGDYEGAEKELLTARQHATDQAAIEAALRKLPLQRGIARAESLMAGRKYARVMEELVKIPREFASDPAVLRLTEGADQGKRIILAQAALDASDHDEAFKIAAELKRELGDSNEQVNTIIKDAEHRQRAASEGKDAIRKGKSALIANEVDAALSYFLSVMNSSLPDSQEYKEAYEGYNDALARKYAADKKRIDAYLDRAGQLLEASNHEAVQEALEDAENIIKDKKFKPDADMDSRLTKLRSETEHARTRHEHFTSLIAEADEKLKAEDYGGSLALYDQLLQIVGERPELRRTRDRVAKLLNQREGGRSARDLAVAAIGKRNFDEAWKQTLLAVEYDPRDTDIQNLQQQIISQLRDLAHQAFQAQDLDNTLQYVRQWRSFWPFDPDAVHLEQRVNQDKSIRKAVSATLRKARKAKDPEERLRILDEGIAELSEHHQELSHERQELKAKLEVEEEVRMLLEIAARYKETGYFGKAIDGLERIQKADPANRKIAREIERARHESLLFLQNSFQEIEQKLAGADFEGSLDHIDKALRATEQPEEKNRLTALKERVYRVQKKARLLDGVIYNAERHLDQKQYEFASQTIQGTMDQIKAEDRQDPTLEASLRKLDDIATVVESQLRIQRQTTELIKSARAAGTLHQYETSIEDLELVIELDPGNVAASTLLSSITKSKKESDELVRNTIERAQAVQGADVDRALNLLGNLPAYAQELADVRSLTNELEYRKRAKNYRQFIDLGNEYFRHNEFQEAIKAFESALNIKDGDVDATNALGIAKREEQRARRESAQIEITKGKQDEEKAEFMAALDHYREALELDPENEAAKMSYQKVKDDAIRQKKGRDSRRALIVSGVTVLLLIIGLPTFFAMGGPGRIAALFPTPTNTSTPTSTPTSPPTPLPTNTPIPTVTASPTFAAGAYPGTFYPVTTISYFPDPLLSKSEIGSWSGLFYICNHYVTSQLDTFLIAAHPEDCTAGRTLGWVNGRFVMPQFNGEFPPELTTPGP